MICHMYEAFQKVISHKYMQTLQKDYFTPLHPHICGLKHVHESNIGLCQYSVFKQVSNCSESMDSMSVSVVMATFWYSVGLWDLAEPLCRTVAGSDLVR